MKNLLLLTNWILLHAERGKFLKNCFSTRNQPKNVLLYQAYQGSPGSEADLGYIGPCTISGSFQSRPWPEVPQFYGPDKSAVGQSRI